MGEKVGKTVVTFVRNKVYNWIYDLFIFPIPILIEKTEEYEIYQWIWFGIHIEFVTGEAK